MNFFEAIGNKYADKVKAVLDRNPIFEIIDNKLYFKDRTIFDEELVLDTKSSYYLVIKSKDWTYNFSSDPSIPDRFHLLMYYNSKIINTEGKLIYISQTRLSDEACLTLFDLNIKILGASTYSYECESLKRRHIINQILK